MQMTEQDINVHLCTLVHTEPQDSQPAKTQVQCYLR